MSEVHRTHCCLTHGCCYGDEDCPVEHGRIKQTYPCEFCEWDKEEEEIRVHGKYTVIYGDFRQVGSHSHSITRYKHITLEKEENVLEAALREGIGSSQIWFIFKGHSYEQTN